jgi:hypothetical protein
MTEYRRLAKRTTTKKPAPSKQKKLMPVEGQDAKTGKFVKGNKLGGGTMARTKLAREIFAKYDFDPLESRIVYHNALIAEAAKLQKDAVDGFYTDITNTRQTIYIVDEGTQTTQLDFDKVTYVQGRMDRLLREADQIAATLADYIHPRLRSVDTTGTTADSYTAMMIELMAFDQLQIAAE